MPRKSSADLRADADWLDTLEDLRAAIAHAKARDVQLVSAQCERVIVRLRALAQVESLEETIDP